MANVIIFFRVIKNCLRHYSCSVYFIFSLIHYSFILAFIFFRHTQYIESDKLTLISKKAYFTCGYLVCPITSPALFSSTEVMLKELTKKFRFSRRHDKKNEVGVNIYARLFCGYESVGPLEHVIYLSGPTCKEQEN